MVLVKNDPGMAGDVERHTVLEASLINFARGRYLLLASPAHEHCFGLVSCPSAPVRYGSGKKLSMPAGERPWCLNAQPSQLLLHCGGGLGVCCWL